MAKKKEVTEQSNLTVNDAKIESVLSGLIKAEGLTIKLASELKMNKSRLSTGSIKLDNILGRPLPVGVHEIFGHSGSGKTTLALHMLRNAQQAGKKAIFINMERALNDSIAGKIKDLDLSKLIVVNPNSGEDATESIIKILRSWSDCVIVLDSIAGCSATKDVIEKTMEEKTMGGLGKLMSVFLSKATPQVFDTNSRLILINQIRDVLNPYALGGKQTLGGRAIEHYTTQRIELTGSPAKKNLINVKGLDGKDRVVGKLIKAEIIKNRFTRPSLQCEIPLNFDLGIWTEKEVFDLALEIGEIEKGGAWFTVGDVKTQGESEAMELLKARPDIIERVIAIFTEENFGMTETIASANEEAAPVVEAKPANAI